MKPFAVHVGDAVLDDGRAARVPRGPQGLAARGGRLRGHTQTIGASFWPYYTRIHGEWVLDDVGAAGGRIAAPLTYLDFPKELVHVPREVVETVFDVERWETLEHGGHFPALERTELLARSVREFSRSPRS